jgi:DNA-binding transcriptional LysR family regulator
VLTSDHLDLLLTVIDKGSFSAAARALGRTPSAISMAIAHLEAELNLVLFDRSSREPTPTAALTALLPDARAIAARLHALRAHAQHLSEGVEDTLRIGVAAELDNAPVVRALGVVAARYPALGIEVMTAPQDGIVDALHRAAVDMCVAYGGLDLDAQEQIYALWNETLLAVAAPDHPLLADGARPGAIERLAGHRQIVVAQAGRLPTDVRPVIGNRIWKVNDTATAIALVKAGHGWANLPAAAIQPLVDAAALAPLTFTNISNGLVLPVYLRLPKHAGLGKAGNELVKALREAGKAALRS